MSRQPDYHIELMKYIEKHNYKPRRKDSIKLDNGITIEKVGRVSDYYRKKYPDYKEFFENKFNTNRTNNIETIKRNFENLRNGKTEGKTAIQKHFNGHPYLLDINSFTNNDKYNIYYLQELKKAIDDGFTFNFDTSKINLNKMKNINISSFNNFDEFINYVLSLSYGNKERIKDLFRYIINHHEELKTKSTITRSCIENDVHIGREHIDIVKYANGTNHDELNDKILNIYKQILDYYGIKFESINISYYNVAIQDKNTLINILNQNITENKTNVINLLNVMFNYIDTNQKYFENGSDLYKIAHSLCNHEIKYNDLNDDEMNMLYHIMECINKAYSNKQ